MSLDKEWLEKMIELQNNVKDLQPAWLPNVEQMVKGLSKLNPGQPIQNQYEDDNLKQLWSQESFPLSQPTNEPFFSFMETKNDIVISCFLPGIKKSDDLTIKLHGLNLFISGQRRRNYDGREETSSFHKTLLLPTEFEPETAKASYRNGHLEINLKKKLMQTKIINVDFK